MARCAQRLPASAIPEYRLVAAMRIDVIDDGRRADQIMTLAFHAKRMLVQKGGTFSSPALRAVECACNWIAPSRIILVALTLVAPSDGTVDRWTNGHGADLIE